MGKLGVLSPIRSRTGLYRGGSLILQYNEKFKGNRRKIHLYMDKSKRML